MTTPSGESPHGSESYDPASPTPGDLGGPPTTPENGTPGRPAAPTVPQAGDTRPPTAVEPTRKTTEPSAPSAPVALTPQRLSVGRDLLALSFLLVLGVFVVAVAFYDTAQDVATVIGPITTLVGTLIGVVFGVQTANQGREREAQKQQTSTNVAVAAALTAPPTAGGSQVSPPGSGDAGSFGALLQALTENTTANRNPSEESF